MEIRSFAVTVHIHTSWLVQYSKHQKPPICHSQRLIAVNYSHDCFIFQLFCLVGLPYIFLAHAKKIKGEKVWPEGKREFCFFAKNSTFACVHLHFMRSYTKHSTLMRSKKRYNILWSRYAHIHLCTYSRVAKIFLILVSHLAEKVL